MPITTTELQPPSWKQLFAEMWWYEPLYHRYSDFTAFIADGSIRTGKTMWMSLGFVQWGMYTFDGYDFIMAGKTIQSLRRNVIKPLIKRLRGLGYVVTDKKSENMLIVTLGGITNYFYLFGGKDESSQDLVQGLTAAGVYFDEVALMPQSFVNQATGRALTVPGHKYWFNCNPAGPTHYFKTEWIDDLKSKDAIRLHFLMKDNPILDDKAIKQASAMYSGAFYDRYILGKWATAEGVIYPDFSKKENIISKDKIPDKSQLDVMCGVDWGYHHFGSIVVVGYDDRADKYYLLHEITHKNREIDYWVKKAHQIQAIYGDVPFYCDTARPEHIDRFTEEDIDARYADKSVVPGIEIVAGLIKSRKLQISDDEYSMTQEDMVDDDPEDNVLKEIFEYVWQDKEDKPVKKHDDTLDALRYVLYAYYLLHQNNMESFAI